MIPHQWLTFDARTFDQRMCDELNKLRAESDRRDAQLQAANHQIAVLTEAIHRIADCVQVLMLKDGL